MRDVLQIESLFVMKIFILLLLLFLSLFDCEAKILPESPVRLSAQVKSNKNVLSVIITSDLIQKRK